MTNEINELKEENARLLHQKNTITSKYAVCYSCLQEIKEIAERQIRCCTCKFDLNDYKSGCKECESKYAREIAVEILQKISDCEVLDERN